MSGAEDRVCIAWMQMKGLLPKPQPAPRPTSAQRGAQYAEQARQEIEDTACTSREAQAAQRGGADLLARLAELAPVLATTPDMFRSFQDAADAVAAAVTAAMDEHDAPSPLQDGDWAGPKHAVGEQAP